MKIKEYLQQYKADNKYAFGNFIHMFRVEKGYSIREFAIKLDISFVYLSDIEKGARPAPLKHLDKFIDVLNIEDEEVDDFMDLVYLSHQNWPELTDFLTTKPRAREFLRKANELNLSDNVFSELIEALDKDNEKDITIDL